MSTTTEYDKKADDFLERHKLRFRATQKADRCPACGEDDRGCCHGDRYRVTISRRHGGRISFDFWNSLNDCQQGKEPTAYDALACISRDVYCPTAFDEFCGEYGYEQDSRRAERMFKRCAAFATRLRRFFTDVELEELAEIQ